MYTMLTSVQEEQIEVHPANLTVQVNKSWYILVLPGCGVLTCGVLTCILGVVLYGWRHRIEKQAVGAH